MVPADAAPVLFACEETLCNRSLKGGIQDAQSEARLCSLAFVAASTWTHLVVPNGGSRCLETTRVRLVEWSDFVGEGVRCPALVEEAGGCTSR